MTASTVSLEDLIDWTLDQLEDPQERSATCYLPGNLAASSTVTTTLPGQSFDITDLVQIDQTLLLVTDKSADSEPVYTLANGYLRTPLTTHSAGATVYKNPIWSRHRVKKAVLRSFGTLQSLIPLIDTDVFNVNDQTNIVEIPSDTIAVLRVGHYNTQLGRFIEVGDWNYLRDVSTAVSSTGLALQLPSIIDVTDNLEITRKIKYGFSSSDPVESDTMRVPLGGEDLPSLWAAAFIVANKQMSKAESDYIEKSLNDQKQRTQSPDRIARQLWQDFYRRVEETKKDITVPRLIQFRKRPTSLRSSF